MAADTEPVGFIGITALVVISLSTLFQLIGMATNHWVATVDVNDEIIGYSGLWQTCANYGNVLDSCRGFGWTDVQVSHWFRTVQALEVFGFIFGVIALGFMLMYFFAPACQTNYRLKIFGLILSLLAFMFILSADVVIAALKDVQKAIPMPGYTALSWSFGFSMAGCILFIASFITICLA